MSILQQLRAGVLTHSAAEMQALGSELARGLAPDTTLALHGNLGVGKTTFVQGLARGFEITAPVTSPTFNIYHTYRGPRRTLIHLDAYRLETAQQVEDLLLEDFLVSPWCLAIEWPEKIPGWIPADALHLELGIGSDETHRIALR